MIISVSYTHLVTMVITPLAPSFVGFILRELPVGISPTISSVSYTHLANTAAIMNFAIKDSLAYPAAQKAIEYAPKGCLLYTSRCV